MPRTAAERATGGLRACSELLPWRGAGEVVVRWGTCAACVGGVAAGLDLLAGDDIQGSWLGWAAGLGLGAGGLAGLGLGASMAIGALLPRPLGATLWIGLGGAAAWKLAVALDAWSRLGTRHHDLAVTTLVGCGAGGLVAAALLASVQPRLRRGVTLVEAPAVEAPAVEAPAVEAPAVEAPAIARRRWTRWAGAGLLAGTALATAALDRILFPDTYPPFHLALRAAALLAATAAAWVAWPQRPLRRRTMALICACVLAITMWTVATLDARHPAAVGALTDRPFADLAFTAIRALLDADGDGYPAGLGGGDCAPLEPAVHPGAHEIPGNGVDDNCRLGDAPPAPRAISPPDVPLPAEPSPSSVVLVTIDTLRADRMSLYGHDRPTTPRLEHFFRDGLRFEAAYTAGGYTTIAIPSLMRGVYPRRIAWTRIVQTNRLRLFRPSSDQPLPEGERATFSYVLPADAARPPLAWWLQRRGMRTVAVVDDGPSEFLSDEWGTSHGFDTFVSVPSSMRDPGADERTVDAAIAQLDRLSPEEGPFFLWLHLYGPHRPNTRHPETPWFGDDEPSRYDHEIRHADGQVGRFLDALTSGMGERPHVVILTSDHGEELTDRHRAHGRTLRDAAIRVPLLMRGTGVPKGHVRGVATLVDVVPTVLALTRTPAPPGLDGCDWLGPRCPGRRTILVDTWVSRPDGSAELDLTAALDERHRLAFDRLRNVATLHERAAPASRDRIGRNRIGRNRIARNRIGRNRIGERPTHDLELAVYRYYEEAGGPVRMH